jgi:hypothetical protein
LWESSIRPLAELLKIVLSIFNVAIAYFRTESKPKNSCGAVALHSSAG